MMRHTRWIAVALCLQWLACLAPSVRAQQPAGDRVGGRVVNALTARPIARAAVSLEDTTTNHVVAETTAKEDGFYRFDPVPAGKYRLFAQAAGYLEEAYLAHPPFSTAVVTGAGLATDALTLKLTPFSEIDGRVTDETGQPIEHANITLYRENPDAAENRVRRFRGGQTSDDGRYHFDSLPPGRYFLTANAQPWYAVHPQTEREYANFVRYRAAVDPALDVAYPLTFYPNAQEEQGASPITLEGGSVVHANMQMTPQKALTLSVRGLATNGEVPRFAQVTREVFGEQEFVNAQSNLVDGVQQLSGLAPGQYSLRQNGRGNNGFSAQASPVDLTSGSVTMEAPATEPLASASVTVQTAAGEAPPPGLRLNLRDGRNRRVGSQELDARGAAEFSNLSPGTYRFALLGEGKAKVISAVSVDGHPVADEVLHITGGGSLTVKLTASGNPVELDGFARHDGKPVAGSMVVLVPAGSNSDVALYRRDQTDLDGSFTFRNVSPGAYLLVAIDDGWSLRWDDSKALMPYLLHSIPIDVQSNASGVVREAEPVLTQAR